MRSSRIAFRCRRPVGLAVLVLVALGLIACSPSVPAPPGKAQLEVGEILRGDAAGYAQALEPRSFRFPADHGPHPAFRTEWWYFTGNLMAPNGRRFGFHLTFFRSALTPASSAAPRTSAWAADQLYMAHFALADVAGDRTYAAERLSRAALDLAGARAAPFAVWLLDWRAASVDGAVGLFPLRLAARDGAVALDLTLRSAKPLVLQGEAGLSRKSATPGNASYYYSFSRLTAAGSVRVGEVEFAVEGTAWCDREWSTSALGAELVGWDWFALQLAEGTELMIYRLRRADGTAAEFSRGTWIAADGAATRLRREEIVVTPVGEWRSPQTAATYPAGFDLAVPRLGLRLAVTPWIADQELSLSVRYWEGAVRVEGERGDREVTGHGYMELTGY
ncbi:MAG: lipocalin-like domain-containing protein [Planctomycetota bacterium]